jgi:hypothetical protein
MAVQIRYPDKTVQWLPGELFRAHDGFTVHSNDSHRDFANDHEVISMTPDAQVVNWTRRNAPFSDKRWWA